MSIILSSTVYSRFGMNGIPTKQCDLEICHGPSNAKDPVGHEVPLHTIVEEWYENVYLTGQSSLKMENDELEKENTNG